MHVQDAKNKRSFIVKLTLVLMTLFMVMTPLMSVSAEVINKENLDPEEKPGLVEKHLSKFLINLSNSAISLMKAQDVSVLVFQRPEVLKEKDTWLENTSSLDRDEMAFGIFPNALFEGISKIYDGFAKLIPIPIFVLLAIGGLVLLLDLYRSSESRSKAKEYLFGIVIALLLLRFGHLLWDWIIFINHMIVDIVFFTLKASGIEVRSFVSTIWNPSDTAEVMKSPSFMIALLVLGAAVMTFIINYQYMMRMLTLAMLVILFPFVIIATVMPSRRSVLNTWVTQFTSQVFIQTAHAISLALFFFMITKTEDLGFWLVAAMFFGLPAMADLVHRIVGGFTGEGGGGGLGTSISNGSGMGGIMAVTSIARGMMKSKGSNGSKGNMDGISSNNEVGSTNGNMSSAMSSMGSPAKQSGVTSFMSDKGNVQDGSGVGGIPISNGIANGESNGIKATRQDVKMNKAMNERPRGLARAGASIAKTGRNMASSDKYKGVTKGVAAAGLATAGWMAGTMMTGKGQTGAMLGGAAGLGVGNAVNTTRDKAGKGIEVMGEVTQSKASNLKAMDMTKARIGYKDSTQLGNPDEMKRMGQELVGGKVGSAISGIIGQANYYSDKASSTDSSDTGNSYVATNEKRDLDWNIGRQESAVQGLEQQRDMSKMNLERVNAEYGPKSEQGMSWKAENGGTPHPEVAKAQQNHSKVESTYFGEKQKLGEMKQKQQTFYADKQQQNQQKDNKNVSNSTPTDSNPNIPNNPINPTNQQQINQQINKKQQNNTAIQHHANETRGLQTRRRSNGAI
ncbi:hypothetical protein [Psychrobacillus sp. FSL H8-0487]|uniref:hypothetical protein n=1 Tax=Psychrobacillus sp. FSL H8-0487 TaxID=2921391 RepID=UPI0030F806CD